MTAEVARLALLGRRPSRTRIVIAGMFVVLLALAGCGSDPPGPVAEKPNAVISDYLAALEAGDGTRLALTAPPGYQAEVDVADRIDRFGGMAAADVTFDVSNEGLSADILTVRFKTSEQQVHRESEWTENLVRVTGTWYFILGAAPGALNSNSDPAVVTRTS